MKLGQRLLSPVESLFARIGPIEDPMICWSWTGHINKVSGYPQTGNKNIGNGYAHRATFEFMFDEELPETGDHLCNNRWCVNPWHIAAASIGDNVRRAFENRLCPRGHRRVSYSARYPARKRCSVCANERSRAKRASVGGA